MNKELRKAYMVKWRKDNPNYMKKWYGKNKKKHTLHMKEYNLIHQEERCEYQKRFRKEHPKYFKSYVHKNREKMRAYWRKYYKNVRSKKR